MTALNHPGAAPPPGSDDERLPCGRLLSRVWSAWEDGTQDAHLGACPHCLRAVGELEALETTVRALRDTPAVADDGDRDGFDAAALTQRVMDVVRLELRPGRPLPLGGTDEDLWIMESVAARTVRAAAERVPGVQAGSCGITVEDADPAGGGHDRVTVRLSVLAPRSAPDLRALAELVRRAVEDEVDRRIGLDVAAVDIRVTDLTGTDVGDPPPDFEEGRK